MKLGSEVEENVKWRNEIFNKGVNSKWHLTTWPWTFWKYCIDRRVGTKNVAVSITANGYGEYQFIIISLGFERFLL